MSSFDIILIVGGLALVAFVAWPFISKDLDMRTDEWLRNPANVKKLGDIANSRYAHAYYGGCNCGR
jgi:hypothetical protein